MLDNFGACGNPGNVLPAMKHAAEELRALGVASDDGKAPTVRQATRTANDILRANDDTTHRIRKLHRDALTVRGSSAPATRTSPSIFLSFFLESLIRAT